MHGRHVDLCAPANYEKLHVGITTMKPRVLLYCLLGGLPLAIPAIGSGNLGWWLLSAIVLAAGFVPVAFFGPRRPLAQFGVIAPVLLIVGGLCIWTEAWLFVPAFRQHALRTVTASTTTYLFVAAALAALAWWLKLARPDDPQVERRGIAASVVLVLIAGFAYLVYYAFFGAITYIFFTRVYYPQATQQVGQLGLWFWGIQIGRGVLITLAVLPVVFTLRLSRGKAAIAVGLLLWIVGGLAPLLVPNGFMAVAQRIIHVVEIFTQNVALGMTVVWLLRRKSKPAADRMPEVAAAAP